MWNVGLYGQNYPDQATSSKQNVQGNAPVNPLRQSDNYTTAEWFGRFHDYPPAPGDFMELPAGGVFMGDLGCNRAFTAMRGERLDKEFGKLPEFACNVSAEAYRRGEAAG